MRILKTTIKRKWYDLISEGIKKEEYREIKPYWTKRLEGRKYDSILFRNGYNSSSPTVLCEYLGYTKGVGNPDWGAPKEEVYIIKLGKVLEINGRKV